MSLSILRQGIEVERLVGEQRAQLLVKAEVIVSGAGRDSVEILMEDARLTMDSAEVQSERVVLGGQVFCQAIYRLGDNTQVSSLTASAAFEHIAEIAGAGARMSARVEGEVEHVDAQYEGGRVQFYVSVTIKVRVTHLTSVEAISELQGVEGLEQAFSELRSNKLNAESGSPVTLRDEVNLPEALNAQGVMMYWATPRIAQAVRDLGGARVSGDISVEALIHSGVQGRPVALVRDALTFDQLVEFPDWLSGDVEATAEVKDLTVSVEGGDGEGDSLLRLTCEMDVAVRVNGLDSMTALSDAYATGAEAVSVTRETVTLLDGVKMVNAQQPFKAAMLLPDGAPGVGTVLAVRTWPTVSETSSEGGVVTVTGVMDATVLYMPGGSDRLSATRAELPFEMRFDGELAEGAWLRVTASDAEASALMSDRLELRCALKATGSSRITHDAAIAVDAAVTAVEPRRKGVVISYPGDGDTLWAIGKRYRMPVAAIREQNNGLERAEAGKPLILRV